ncbi:MAG: hypothetical protein GY851_15230, partial [bacterium]|nr:hypothetical protein [bacterium]
WLEANEHLKRPEDATAVESLRWLMRKGRKHNTIVSLHTNMFDAYEDSPLWDEYVAQDIIGKDTDGNVIFGEVHGGQRSAQISYTQEWKSGLARKRIDGLLAMLPELQEAKTIHVDAFHSCRPLGRDEPISPYLGYTMDQEAATQRKIYRYWRDQGLDVTSEGAAFLRPDPFIGLQPMAWANEPEIQGLPATLYCSTPMRAEPEIIKDPTHLTGLLEQFCLRVVPWYYENRLGKTDAFRRMRLGTDICMPALWKDTPTLVAYSRKGSESKEWRLPSDWEGVKRARVSRITVEGLEGHGEVAVKKGRLRLDMEPGVGLIIVAKD